MEKIINFMRSNIDVFAWKPNDKPYIDPEVITQKLNIEPKAKLVQ